MMEPEPDVCRCDPRGVSGGRGSRRGATIPTSGSGAIRNVRMPFYIRKAFNFGPIRLNLSKSGSGCRWA
jgi:hypothetical protein